MDVFLLLKHLTYHTTDPKKWACRIFYATMFFGDCLYRGFCRTPTLVRSTYDMPYVLTPDGLRGRILPISIFSATAKAHNG